MSSGVYTSEQAARGRDVYFGMCRSCHTAATHTGVTFATWWAGKTLWDLFDFISTKMPKNEPGSLAIEDYADVTSYILQLNGMRPGKEELPLDTLTLKQIKVDVPPPPKKP